MPHQIQQFSLERGSLEVEYVEQYFEEFHEKKSSAQVVQRLRGRQHLILISMAAALDDPQHLVPVAFKVGHELFPQEVDPQLADLTLRLKDCLNFPGRRVFYSWIGGTRQEYRGQGHYRALTEQQEEWAHKNGFDEMVVKTKNRFYAMRATLDHLQFNIMKFEPHPTSNPDSKVYMQKSLGPEVLRSHLTSRVVMVAA